MPGAKCKRLSLHVGTKALHVWLAPHPADLTLFVLSLSSPAFAPEIDAFLVFVLLISVSTMATLDQMLLAAEDGIDPEPDEGKVRGLGLHSIDHQSGFDEVVCSCFAVSEGAVSQPCDGYQGFECRSWTR